MDCKGFQKLMAWQAREMAAAIDEDKWHLSERAGEDAGKEKAEEHFTKEHLDRCAAGWRKEFCGALCEHREGCELGAAFIGRDGVASA